MTLSDLKAAYDYVSDCYRNSNHPDELRRFATALQAIKTQIDQRVSEITPVQTLNETVTVDTGTGTVEVTCDTSHIDQRIEDLRRETHERFDHLQAHVNQQLSEVSGVSQAVNDIVEHNGQQSEAIARLTEALHRIHEALRQIRDRVTPLLEERGEEPIEFPDDLGI